MSVESPLQKNTLSKRSREAIALSLATTMLAACCMDSPDEPLKPERVAINLKNLEIAQDKGESIDASALTDFEAKVTTLSYVYKNGELIPSVNNPGNPEVDKLEHALDQNEAFIAAATKAGYLDSIDFVVDPSTTANLFPDGYMSYSAKDNYVERSTVTWGLSPEAELDTRYVEMMSRHEILHALLQGTEIADKEPGAVGLENETSIQRQTMNSLCADLRQAAFNEILTTESVKPIVADLDHLGENIPELIPQTRVIAESLENGTYVQLLPREGDILKKWPSNLPNCLGESPARTLVRMLTDEQIERLSSDLGEKSLSASMGEIDTTWAELTSQSFETDRPTIVSVLREGNYLQRLGASRANTSGHWFDNANEAGASLINLAISLPEDFKQQLEKIPVSERKKIYDFIVITAGVLSETYKDSPDLVRIMDDVAENFSNENLN